jgi:hypothetical protein
MTLARRAPRLALLTAATAGLLTCQDSTRSHEPSNEPPPEPPPVSLAYVCGRNFDIENGDSSALIIRFDVSTGESGSLALAPVTAGAPSRTRLTTATAGDVHLSVDGVSAGDAANAGTACPPPDPAPPEPQASRGEWSEPFAWPIVAVHLHLLPDGRVLSFGRIGQPQLWDPSTGAFTELPVSTNIFCAGHTFLADGRLLVAGGHISEDHGLPATTLFNFATGAWTEAAPMATGRWYPTTTTLPDGRVLVMAGGDQNGLPASVPEIWDGTSWTSLDAADRVLPYYPRAFVAPNGKIFYAGELQQSSYLDVSTGTWTPVAASLYGDREYGSAVMYRPGKVLIVGGSGTPSGPPTATAETIDLADASPAWHFTGSMASARRQFNVTLLPDGRVVATGGTSAPGFTDPVGAVHAAEAWDPATGQWTTWASNAVNRVYHSTTILLPDGRLLHAGSGDGGFLPRELSGELFSPPYLFHGPRPAIASAPAVVTYAERFFVETPDAGTVVAASWVRLSSVTHAFDQNQRYVPLDLERTPGGVTVTAPVNPNVAPPGHYMVFLLNGDGVPSVAKIVQVR